MTNVFLLSWDNTGLESVINVTQIEKEQAWSALQDKPGPKLNSLVSSLILRARYNSQRHYEIYTVTVEDSINEDDLRTMFDNDPQGSADLVRVRGNKIYSDRVKQSEVKIV